MTVRIERVLKNVKHASLIDISEQKTYTLGGGGLETFVADQVRPLSSSSIIISAVTAYKKVC
jgi:hypothetical protein